MAADLELPIAFAGGNDDDADRLSNLPEGILEHVLSFLPAADAVRSSVLSRRWRGAWAHAHALNLSDERHQGRFPAFARAALARYGSPDIPALNVAISCSSNLSPDTAAAAWLRDAMERVVGSFSISVIAPGPLEQLVLPRRLRAKSISLKLSGIIFQHGPIVLPEPGGVPASSYGGLTELSLKRVRLQEHVRPLGEFLSACCPRLKKLRLRKVSGGGDEPMWPLVLRLDLLEEFVVERMEILSKLQVVCSNLRVLVVRCCFHRMLQWGTDTVVEISAPRLEAISWSDGLPEHLIFVTGSRCIRRLADLCFYLPGEELASASAVRLLGECSGADHLSVSIDIPDYTTPSRLTRENLEHVPHLPNIRVLSLKVVAVLRFISCPIAPSIYSFIKRCPNEACLHIDLSMLHQFSRLHPDDLMVPGYGDDDKTEVAETWQISGSSDPWRVEKDQLQLGSLREIRFRGFMGTVHEMEVADLLFGAGAARPSLERISISLYPQLRQGADGVGATTLPPLKCLSASFDQLIRHMDGIGVKMEAQFPLAGGSWEFSPRKEVTWSRTTERA